MKKKAKNCAQGGDMNPIAASLLGILPQGVNMAQSLTYKPEYTPGGNTGFNIANVAGSALSAGLGPQTLIAGGLAAATELIKDNKRKHTTVYGSPGQYASGGDMTLSNQSFKVDAPANRTDAKHYPQFNVNLDNDEVVDASRNIVYSNKLTNPRTGNTYADDATVLEKTKGIAQKKVAKFKDPISSNTLEVLNNMSRDLYMSQELVATTKGKRDVSGATVQGRAYGGPVDPVTGQPFMHKEGMKNLYYDPYTQQTLTRRKDGKYFPYDGEWQGDKFFNQNEISQHMQQYPKATAQPTAPTQQPNQAGPYNPQLTSNEWQDYSTGRMPEYQINEPTAPGAPVVAPRPGQGGPRRPSTATPPINGQPAVDDGFRFYNDSGGAPVKRFAPLDQLYNPYTNMDGYDPNTLEQFPNESLKNRQVSSDQMSPIDRAMAARSTGVGTATTPPPTNSGNGFTTGDYLQMGSALASFAPLLQGAERETPYLDNTQVSKASYDVNPQLYQSNRSYQNAVNNIDTQSPNLRRAMQNGLYAQKLNADNQVLNQYQQMNNQSQVDYENRLSNQRRYNIGQTTYTNDLNDRNRGAYNQSLDNAFRTVGNFGSALNQRQQGQDVLKIYKETYSDVYDRILNALSQK